MHELKYRIVRAADNGPLVTLDSPLGNGQEIRPDALRRLATELSKIAEQAESRDMGRAYLPLNSCAEY